MAQRAKQAATAAAREAGRLIQEARKRAQSAVCRRRLKQRLQKAGRVLKAASQAAVVAAVAAGVGFSHSSSGWEARTPGPTGPSTTIVGAG